MPDISSLFTIDSFNSVPTGLYLLLFAGALFMAPRQDLAANRWNYILVLAGTMIAYVANNTGLFWLGWTLSAFPLLRSKSLHRLSRASILVGCIALGLGMILLALGGKREWAFALVMLAVIQRKGLFPIQSWVADSFEKDDLILAGLVFNGHLGVVAVARIALPLMQGLSRSSIMILSDIGLATAVIGALTALSEKRPRRLLAYISVSQASSILAGLEGRNQEAVTGSLMHWMVVSISTTALFAVIRMLEVRNGGSLTGVKHLGLGGKFPRLAVFFAFAAVALVGLPGTMGFCSEDLLLHGALEAHPWIGLAIPVATALNAISIFRLFSGLFLGSRQEKSTFIPDATLRERLPLTAIALALVIFGVFPQMAINLRSRAAGQLVSAESGGKPQSAEPASKHQ